MFLQEKKNRIQPIKFLCNIAIISLQVKYQSNLKIHLIPVSCVKLGGRDTDSHN